MNNLNPWLFKILVVAVLTLIGYTFGRLSEARHLRQLDKREPPLKQIRLHIARFEVTGVDAKLVVGNVVIAQDYFKMLASYLLSLFGRQLTPYESLLERARREAMCRMKEQAQALGAYEIYGFRLEVLSVNDLGTMVEAIAYGTAVTRSSNQLGPVR